MHNDNWAEQSAKKSVLEFGAIGDGKHDDYYAFQTALNSGVTTLTIPQGIYMISQTLKVNSDTYIVADRNAKIVMKSTSRKKEMNFF